MKIRIEQLYTDLKASTSTLRDSPALVEKSRLVVERALAEDRAYYGINTGFGVLSGKRIPAEDIEELQHNLLLSHAVGVGDAVPIEITRLMLGIKIHALGLGFSGVSLSTFNRLLLLEERDLIPVVPSRGSVGASGDLAPLAHLALPLIGHGELWCKGSKRPTADCLRDEGLDPIRLLAKDGLALINGTELMSAYTAHVLHRVGWLVKLADVLAAMSLEALQGSLRPFDERIHKLRPFEGQRKVAANIRLLLKDSEILESHRNCGKVQDPYSLRCVPQVHGASRDSLQFTHGIVEIELNSVTDNPLVFPDGDIVSGGNFHGQPLALSADQAAIALSELASISERRTYLLLEGNDGLPRLLMRETGLNSGFMIPQYTAAALVSENKVYCHPASVDSIPTCLGHEDHVSMGSIGALKLLQVMTNVEHVLAIELLTSAQALDFRLPLKAGKGVVIAHEYIRKNVPHREQDVAFQEDLNRALQLVQTPQLISHVEKRLAPLQ